MLFRSGALLVLSVSRSCGAENISEGTIIDKGYVGPSEYTSMMCVSYGKFGCQAYVPLTIHEDEYWWVDLQDCTDTDHPMTTQMRYDDCKHGRQHVSSTVYAEARPGSWYPFNIEDVN